MRTLAIGLLVAFPSVAAAECWGFTTKVRVLGVAAGGEVAAVSTASGGASDTVSSRFVLHDGDGLILGVAEGETETHVDPGERRPPATTWTSSGALAALVADAPAPELVARRLVERHRLTPARDAGAVRAAVHEDRSEVRWIGPDGFFHSERLRPDFDGEEGSRRSYRGRLLGHPSARLSFLVIEERSRCRHDRYVERMTFARFVLIPPRRAGALALVAAARRARRPADRLTRLREALALEPGYTPVRWELVAAHVAARSEWAQVRADLDAPPGTLPCFGAETGQVVPDDSVEPPWPELDAFIASWNERHDALHPGER